jgi:hypothetical protein
MSRSATVGSVELTGAYRPSHAKTLLYDTDTVI